jgi:hypothetical protein
MPRIAVYADIPSSVYEKLPLNEKGEIDLTGHGLLEIGGLVIRDSSSKRIFGWIKLAKDMAEKVPADNNPLLSIAQSGFGRFSQFISPNVISLGLSTMQMAMIEQQLREISHKIDEIGKNIREIKEILKRETAAHLNYAVSVINRAEKTQNMVSREDDLRTARKTLGEIQEAIWLEIEDILSFAEADRYPDAVKLKLINHLIAKAANLAPFIVRSLELQGEHKQIGQIMQDCLERLRGVTIKTVDYFLKRVPTANLFYKAIPKDTLDLYIGIKRWRLCPEDMFSTSSFEILRDTIEQSQSSFWELTTVGDDFNDGAEIVKAAAQMAPLPIAFWNNAVAREMARKSVLLQDVVKEVSQTIENYRRLEGYDAEITAIKYRNWSRLSLESTDLTDPRVDDAILARLGDKEAGLVVDADFAESLGIDLAATGAEILEI